ncbi:hypothetical protein Tco_0277406 [Tanacetum coccineum]
MRTRSQTRRRRQQQTLPVVENLDLEEPIVEQNVVPFGRQSNNAKGGNFSDRCLKKELAIIESKSKVVTPEVVLMFQDETGIAPLSNSLPSNNSFEYATN